MQPTNFRMPDVNHITISGRVIGEIKDREIGSTMLTVFTIVNTRYQKENKEKQTWIQVKCWGKLAEVAINQLSDKMPLIVEGVLETESWEKDGQKIQKTVIVASKISLMAWPYNAGSKQKEPEAIADEGIPF